MVDIGSAHHQQRRTLRVAVFAAEYERRASILVSVVDIGSSRYAVSQEAGISPYSRLTELHECAPDRRKVLTNALHGSVELGNVSIRLSSLSIVSDYDHSEYTQNRIN